MEETKFRHENHVRRMKTQFLRERRAYDAEMASQVRLMTQRASQVCNVGMSDIAWVVLVFLRVSQLELSCTSLGLEFGAFDGLIILAFSFVLSLSSPVYQVEMLWFAMYDLSVLPQ